VNHVLIGQPDNREYFSTAQFKLSGP